MLRDSIGRLRNSLETATRRVSTELVRQSAARDGASRAGALRDGAGRDGAGSDAELAQVADALPVVARLVVEIRSDGSRTVARGALEDVVNGERVAVHAQGTTPAQLAGSLAKALLTLPLLAGQTLRAVTRARLDRSRHEP